MHRNFSITILGVLLCLLVLTDKAFAQFAGINFQESSVILSSDTLPDTTAEIKNLSVSKLPPHYLAFETVNEDENLLWVYTLEADTLGHEQNRLKNIYPGIKSDYGLAAVSELDWAPVLINGDQWFTFVSSIDGDEEIFIGRINAPGYYQLTDNATNDSHPVWSPNGDAILFTGVSNKADIAVCYGLLELLPSLEPLEEDEIINISEDVELRFVTDNTDMDTFGNWSPVTKHIVYQSNSGPKSSSDIYVLSIEDEDAYEFSDPIPIAEDSSINYIQPSFSPDGKKIAFYGSENQEVITDKRIQLYYVEKLEEDDERLYSANKRIAQFKDIIKSGISRPMWSSDSEGLIVITWNGTVDYRLEYINLSADSLLNSRKLMNQYDRISAPIPDKVLEELTVINFGLFSLVYIESQIGQLTFIKTVILTENYGKEGLREEEKDEGGLFGLPIKFW